MSHHQFERREWRKIHVNRQAMGGNLGSTTAGTTAATSAAAEATTSATSTSTSTSTDLGNHYNQLIHLDDPHFDLDLDIDHSFDDVDYIERFDHIHLGHIYLPQVVALHRLLVRLPQPTAVTTHVPTTTSSHSSVFTTETITKSTHASLSSSASASASASSTASADTGMSTGTIIGIGIGCLVGIAFVVIVIGFLIRRWRRHREEKDVFDASQFRSSAVLLDDDISMSGDSGRGGSGWNSHLRPPTMIERHVNNSPASVQSSSIVGPRPFNEMDIPSGGFDNDPFAAAAYSRDPSVISQQMGGHESYLNKQPSQIEAQLNRDSSQTYQADPFQQQQEAQYVDLNRVPSVGSAESVGVAVTTPSQEVSHDSFVASSTSSSESAKPAVTSPLAREFTQPDYAPTSQSAPPAHETVMASRHPCPCRLEEA
ncbi:hypothetical protein EDD18DRAFT_1354262 [Armillaria luteobubalina]|uniref:Mid2 domain-containing protein n=1 Tax=Armillaria luteobubalina TaxID=153913 RepID=A0AA39UNL8_9AGAR|nr:hypothetical protein EDD18DRAFT_1354262 [Armillaria luteobubalina]